MKNEDASLSRRSFVRDLSLGAGVAFAAPGVLDAQTSVPKVKLGFDNFSIRALGWKAPRLLEYADKQKMDAILFSDLDVFESHEEGYLKEIKQEASKLGISIQAGTGGICPTSPKFIDKYGSAEDHLKRTIKVAEAVGSPVARCYLGTMKDRQGLGGIQKHVESTIQVCKKVRKFALDAGVKIAIENHAGHMHSRELADLIERAGPEYVGATLDTGNATWTMEDPIQTLENLAPFTVSSGIRDSMVWEIDQGAAIQWTAMGEGCVDLKAFAKRWAELCPKIPIQLEIISGFAKPFNYLEPDFWPPYESIRADDFSKFVALAKK
ncbi:MAG: sugar phosphate isomerase/epimerase, partial [Opitutales bacterium]